MKQLLIMMVALVQSSTLAAPFVFPAAWSTSKPAEARVGGTLRTATPGRFSSYNPFTVSETASLPGALSAGGLFIYNPANGEYQPYMAESYNISGNKTVWTFKIRAGMKWSDGEPISANDWVTTWKIHTDSSSESNLVDSFTIDGKHIQLSAPDVNTLRVILPKPSADALEVLNFDPQPTHIFGTVYAKSGYEGVSRLWKLSEDPKNLVNSGPFVISSFRVGERVIWKKNPFYGVWNKDSVGNALPYLDGRVMTVLPNSTAALASFLSGDVDSFNPVSADQLASVKRAIDAGNLSAQLHVNAGSSFDTTFITFNWRRSRDSFKEKLFRNVIFRRAMSHLANRAAMVQLALGGLGQAIYTGVYGAFPDWIANDVSRYDFAPDQARLLLKQLGFERKNADGVLVNRSGRALEFELLTVGGNSFYTTLSQIFADEAKKIGVRVTVNAVAEGNLYDLINSTQSDRGFDAVLMSISGANLSYPINDNVVQCNTNLHIYNNQACIAPFETEITALFQRGRVELDSAKRKSIAKEIQKIEAQNQPWIYLISRNIHFAWLKKIHGELPEKYAGAVTGARKFELTWIGE